MTTTERTDHMSFDIISIVEIKVGMCADFFSDEFLSCGRKYAGRMINSNRY